MKSLLSMLALVSVALFCLPSWGDESALAGEISGLIGEVTIIRKTAPGHRLQARLGLKVAEGDTVITAPEARLEITFEGNYVIRCDAQTTLIIELARWAAARIHLPGGRLWIYVKRFLEVEGIYISSAAATAQIKGTILAVESDSTTDTYTVYRGAVVVTPADTAGISDPSLSVPSDHQLVLVRVFDQYVRDQEKSFEEFRAQHLAEFEEYRLAQQRSLDSLRHGQERQMTDRPDHESLFHPLGAYLYARRPIGQDDPNPWVLWNQERDRQLDGE